MTTTITDAAERLAYAIQAAWHSGRFTALDLRDGRAIANAIIESGVLAAAPAPPARSDNDLAAICTTDARAFELDKAGFKIADLESQLAEARERMKRLLTRCEGFAINAGHRRLEEIPEIGAVRDWLKANGGGR